MQYIDFNGIAFAYDFLKTIIFGRSIEKSQVEFLSIIPFNASVLIIGGGTGKLLKEIWLTRRARNITYLEISEKMLEISKKRMAAIDGGNQQGQNIVFIKGSVENLDPAIKYDAIFTPFVLDVIPEARLPVFLKAVDNILEKHGLWFFSDFQISASNFLLKLFQRALEKAMYIFFYFTSGLKGWRFPDFNAYFLNLGYTTVCSANFYMGFVKSKVLKRGSFDWKTSGQ